MAATTTTQTGPAVANYYNRALLMRVTPQLLHQQFAKEESLPANHGNTMVFRRYGNLAAAITPLTEGTTPGGSQLSKTDITVNIDQYGDFVEITDKVDITVEDKVLTEAAQILGDQAGLTLDVLTRDVINAGSIVYLCGVAAPTTGARTDIDEKINTTSLEFALRTLRAAKAKMKTKPIKASTSVGTKGVRAAYWAIIHTDMIADVEALPGFILVNEYASGSEVAEYEIGSWKNIRFLATTEAKIWLAGGAAVGTTGLKSVGATSVDVYSCLIFGEEAFGTVKIGKNVENIRKPFGAGNDPLNQRATSGWKAWFAAKILNDAFMVRIEAGVTAY